MSLVLRDWPRLLPLAAGVAVAEVAGGTAAVKWPNDVLLGGRKAGGILAEGRPQEGWMLLGVGLNVAVRLADLPAELRESATGLGLEPADVEPVLAALLAGLERWLAAPAEAVLSAFRARDALAGHDVAWANGRGRAAGVDEEGRLLVDTPQGCVALDAGEVHLKAPKP
jgi:BirA family biotin operon repressor/biotin-[acetyl-CoA-carboxylase] ligase